MRTIIGSMILVKHFKRHKTPFKNVGNATRPSPSDRLRVQECRARVAFEIACDSDGIIMSYVVSLIICDYVYTSFTSSILTIALDVHQISISETLTFFLNRKEQTGETNFSF